MYFVMKTTGFPKSLREFQAVFATDGACAKYLEEIRWGKEGFVCPKCGIPGTPYRFANRPEIVRCRSCKADTSLTAQTLMHKSHTGLSTWFWAAYLVTTQTPGQSALQFQRQLAIGRYETAFQMLHKLRAGMVRVGRGPIGGEHQVEIATMMIGGPSRHENAPEKVMVAIAVEVCERKPGEQPSNGNQKHSKGMPLKRPVYGGRIRLEIISDESEIQDFIDRNVVKGAEVHLGVGENPEPLRLGHLILSNLQTWLLGTHHGVSQDHLQAYLNEFVFRFNRRFYPMDAFAALLSLAVKVMPPTYEDLYHGGWKHPV